MSTTVFPQPGAGISVDNEQVLVTSLRITDPMARDALESAEPDQRPQTLLAMIDVGARGMHAMGAAATAGRVGDVVDRLMSQASHRAEEHLEALFDQSRRQLLDQLDPNSPSSVTRRSVTAIDEAHRRALDRLDPARRESFPARFLDDLRDAVGPAGALESVLSEALDPAQRDSAMGRALQEIERQFVELRDLLVGDRERTLEAEKGTAKGRSFEDAVDTALRSEARLLGGATVERTATTSGDLGAGAVVGDFVVELPNGATVVVEAKRTARIGLRGADGILTELDRAMVNRQADWAVCVSHGDAYPAEVGPFGVYGRRVLVVDDGEGALIRLALRWITAAHGNDRAEGSTDRHVIEEGIERLRGLATGLSRAKRTLATMRSSIDALRAQIDDMRVELLDAVDDLGLLTRRPAADHDPTPGPRLQPVDGRGDASGQRAG